LAKNALPTGKNIFGYTASNLFLFTLHFSYAAEVFTNHTVSINGKKGRPHGQPFSCENKIRVINSIFQRVFLMVFFIMVSLNLFAYLTSTL
jgi:hypothetical protein